MVKKSARLTAGHFFRRALPSAAALTLLGAACGGGEEPAPSLSLPAMATPAVVIELTGGDPADGLPESLAGVPNTSWGRFHVLDQSRRQVLSEVFHRADSSGLLILAVVPCDTGFTGGRDHLVIRTGEGGIPFATEPDMDPRFTADSLWSDPTVIQETVTGLVDFFKPDLVLMRMDASGNAVELVEFWSMSGSTACIFSPPGNGGYRGWGALTGIGIEPGTLYGMNISGFQATALMLSGLEWRDTGSPVLEAFSSLEEE